MRYRFDGLELDDDRFALVGADGPVHVEPQVFELLRYLLVHRERVVPKEELLDEIWGDRFVSESALTSRVKTARQAVGDDGQAQRVIKTVHGRGYQWVAEVATGAEQARRGLPRLRNAVLGRSVDLERVSSLLSTAPLVTISGPGGIGKTTLAVTVATRVGPTCADGVVFVDLAPVPTGGDVTRAVAEAAGIEGAAARTIDGVAAHLAELPVLVVLDNCEHVLVSAAALVDQLLDAGGPARVLTTSREPLGVVGEHLWPLGPLEEAATALFVARAQAAEPRVDWDPADPAVVELCRRLDGVPLAIELAAGQLRRFGLDEIRDRLGDRFADLATGTAGDDRHATIATAIDWSYRLLDPSEQRLLRWCGAFPGTFDTAAVEAVAPDGDGPPLTVFGQLVEKSLIVRLPGSGRYRLLETIRSFVQARAAEAGELDDLLEQHRRVVTGRVAATARVDRWLSARLAAHFRADLDDARQAFRRCVDAGALGDAVELAVGASFLWRNAIGCAEGEGWVSELLETDLAPVDRLWVQILRADLGQGRGDHVQLFDAAGRAQELVATTDDPVAACLAAHYGSMVHLTDPETAVSGCGPAVELAERSGDRRLVALMEAFLGVARLVAEDPEGAADLLDRNREQTSEDGYDHFIHNWASWTVALAARDVAGARRGMARQQEYLVRTGIVETWITTFSRAVTEIVEGADGGPLLRRAMELAHREGYDAAADCVLALAFQDICAGRLEAAAALVGTAMHGRFNATAHYVLFRAVLHPPLEAMFTPSQLQEAMGRGRSRTAGEVLSEYGIV